MPKCTTAVCEPAGSGPASGAIKGLGHETAGVCWRNFPLSGARGVVGTLHTSVLASHPHSSPRAVLAPSPRPGGLKQQKCILSRGRQPGRQQGRALPASAGEKPSWPQLSVWVSVSSSWQPLAPRTTYGP